MTATFYPVDRVVHPLPLTRSMNSIHSTYLSSVIIFNRNFVNLGVSGESVPRRWWASPTLYGWGVIETN